MRPPPEPTDAQIAAVRAGFEQAARIESIEMYEDGGPVGLRFAVGENPMLEALVADHEAFLATPIPPLPDLYRASGLVQQDRTIAEEGFDWDALRSWRTRNGYKVRYHLDDQQAEGLELVLGACSAVLAGEPDALGPDEDQRDKGGAAADRGARGRAGRRGVLGRVRGPDRPVADVARFVDELAARLDGFLPAGLAWLRARCLDRSGDTAAAITTLEEAVTADCDHSPALLELASFAADRGDAPAAYRLLQRAGITELPEDESEPDDGELLLAEIEQLALHRPRPQAKRNDPCPCGSGRKYKACHLGREQHPLDVRAPWLYDKMLRFVRDRVADEVAELAHAMAGAMEDPSSYGQLRDSRS